MTALVTAVCVVHGIGDGYYHPTAIDKRPVTGAVDVGELGIAGDRQVDRSHGGRDAAVYVYADEDATRWAEELGREIPPGLFGENVRTAGLDVNGARIGERWRIGDLLLEVRQPRTPCLNLALRMGIDDFHVRFNASGRVGAKCRVVAEGAIAAGDEVVVEARPAHDVTVARVATGMSSGQARGLLATDLALVAMVRNRARRAAERG
jgi:MOSC domain-containing protein YiiM